MDQPITWGHALAAFAVIGGGFFLLVAAYGFGKSRGWWGNDDGPGVE